MPFEADLLQNDLKQIYCSYSLTQKVKKDFV